MMTERQWWLWPALLVVAVMLSGGLAGACPQECSCRHQRDQFYANCSSLPNNGGKVSALTLLPYRGSSVELSDGQFNSFKHLKYLTLKNSSIYFVHKKAFYGAKKIVEIDLSFNYIEELDPTVFQYLNNLTTLSLRGNPIHLVSEVPFLISNSLSHLDIGQCKIESIPRGIFYELKRLSYLTLDRNSIESLEYNSFPKGIKYLDLSYNLIINVPSEVISALTNLGRLNLAGNPINCSCSLMNLQDWLSGRAVILEDDVICTLPPKYKGVSWSKVDENMLCLGEAKREEMQYSGSFFMGNKLYKKTHNRKNMYWDENVQSDQPASVPDSQFEVFLSNNETLAMGEMMRDEEMENNEEEEISKNKESAIESVSGSPKNEEVQPNADDTNVDVTEESPSSTSKATENINLEIADLNSQNVVSEKGADKDNVVTVIPDESNPNASETISNTNVTETHQSNEIAETEVIVNQTQPQPDESGQVEFNKLNEEEDPVDEFKKEGLVPVIGDKHKIDSNITSEESTINPQVNDTNEEESSGQGPLIEANTNEQDEVAHQDLTSTTDINNGTVVGTSVAPVEEEIEEEPVYRTFNEAQQNVPEDTGHVTEGVMVDPTISIVTPENEDPNESETPSTSISPENEQLPTEVQTESTINTAETIEPPINERTQGPSESKPLKIEEMAGAEVVMFCVAILVICLVLYSVYKCRGSKNRQSIIITKDVESNRGTEMQEMASLLPKPEEKEESKNNLKYEEKAPSSETVKLLTEQNENHSPNSVPAAETKKKMEDKNSLNNNTPSSKAPLIKPEKTIVINPAVPIQRTKAKVGIIPDSIPRTPIFLQKTYNGTKNV